MYDFFTKKLIKYFKNFESTPRQLVGNIELIFYVINCFHENNATGASKSKILMMLISESFTHRCLNHSETADLYMYIFHLTFTTFQYITKKYLFTVN